MCYNAATNLFDLLIHFMNIAAKIAAEIEAVRLFYHDRLVFYGYLRHLTSDRDNGHIYGML